MFLATIAPKGGSSGLACLGQAFNFGTETPLSVLEVVALILKVSGREHLRPTILNEVSGEILRQFLDCAKVRARLL